MFFFSPVSIFHYDRIPPNNDFFIFFLHGLTGICYQDAETPYLLSFKKNLKTLLFKNASHLACKAHFLHCPIVEWMCGCRGCGVNMITDVLHSVNMITDVLHSVNMITDVLHSVNMITDVLHSVNMITDVLHSVNMCTYFCV